ncbi:ribosome biogenesis protein BOP1 homolog [Copidosoma floridanum]|uniref:ribosome biogenesis protein BOP1 homolog n=1 Tax=Copidosoma floridanum TaxID=29053 RepID=UPI0006C9D7D2|nr:ribosome biogenesis protein BOP1 homolog [Copidosoma floridanum]
MKTPKKTVKRKQSPKRSETVVQKDKEKVRDEAEDVEDSGTEDLLNGEISGEGDTTDEEYDPENNEESDEEQDQTVFTSDEEDSADEKSFTEEESEDEDSEQLEDSEEDDDDESEEENESEKEEEENESDEEKKEKVDKKILRKIVPNKNSLEKNDNKKSLNTNVKKSSNQKSQDGPKKALSKNKTVGGKKSLVEPESSVGPSNTSVNEYDDHDTSDEEDIRNTVGNIPLKWYDDFDHIGYNTDGKKILKPEKGDQLDNFLKRMEDPDFWRTIKDYQTGQDIVLSDADIELITRIQKQRIPDAQFDEYQPWVDWFSSQVEKMPLRKFPEHKRSFLPSKTEAQKVSKLVHALKMGWIKSSAEMKKERREKKQGPKFYMLWDTDDQAEEMRRIHKHIPAPKRFLPGHAESYNPPPEYIFDSKELKQWHKLKSTPWKRKLHFIPQKYDSLRQVPAYPNYIKERFQRCLDLYLCPRAIKMRLTIDPESLVPQLPSPKDLQPFPTVQSMIYTGHSDMIRCVAVEPMGEYLASGGDDQTLRIWEIATGRCVKVVNCGGIVRSIAWCPNQNLPLIAVAADQKILLINAEVGDRLIVNKADKLLEIIPQSEAIVPERVKTAVQWEQITESDNPDSWKQGIRVILNHFKTVKQVTWHGKGDYFASVMPDGQNRSILIHQLSKRRSHIPISKPKGQVQCVLFHPIKPFLFVATQRNVRIYDLTKQEMLKKLLTNSQWISTMSIHPGGDNLLVGTYDKKLLWFDLDLSTKPYKTLRLHGSGIRGVAYHKRYPLFASGADDRSLIICHGMVYSDLMQNPLIVPLKRLSNHEAFNDFGILDVLFHPIQPWVFSAGADATIRMYT